MRKHIFQRGMSLLLAMLTVLSLLPMTALQAEAASITPAARAATVKWKWPLAGTSIKDISSSYGSRYLNGRSVHYGVDIHGYKLPVYPVREGTVVTAHTSNSGGAGRYVIIDHGYIPVNGDQGKKFYSKYFHFQDVYVRVGDKVTTDTVLGISGASGNGYDKYSGYGWHLHLELLYGGTSSSGNSFNPCPSGYTSKGGALNYPMEDYSDTSGSKFSTSNTRVSYEARSGGAPNIVFISGGGSGNMLPLYNCSGNVTLPKNVFKKNFSAFKGWAVRQKIVSNNQQSGNWLMENGSWSGTGNSVPSGAKLIQDGATIDYASWTAKGSAFELHAVWEGATYTFTFVPDDAKGSPVSSTAKYNTKFDFMAVQHNFTKPGYLLSGWNAERKEGSAGRFHYYSKGWFTEAEAASRKATQKSVYDRAYTIDASWLKDTINSGNTAVYVHPAGFVFHPVWEKDTSQYIVSFDMNGGKGSIEPIAAKKNSKITIPGTLPARDGYIFLGWATEKSDSSAAYQPKGSITSGEDVTLYAVWGSGDYTISYHENGSNVSGMPGNGTKVKGKDYTISSKVPTRKGYTFTEWSTTEDPGFIYAVTHKEYDPGDTYKKNKDLDLYAQWEPKTYTVKYNANGGTGTMKDSTFTYDESDTLRKNDFKRDGYVFDGWTLKADGSGTRYGNKASVKNLAEKGSVTLYAQWLHTGADKVYYVEYDANGGTGTTKKSYIVYGVSTPLEPNGFTREGYSFAGWNTKANGKGTAYTNKQSVKNLTAEAGGVIKLYAQWTKNPDYISECTKLFSMGTIKITASNAWLKSLPCSRDTRSYSEDLIQNAVPVGTTFPVTALYKNTEGKYWYQVSYNGQTGYIYSKQASFTKGTLTNEISIANQTLPQNRIEGKGFDIKGNLSSKIANIYKVSSEIHDGYGKKDSESVTVNAKTYDLFTGPIQKNVTFGLLKPGKCRYVVTASIQCNYSTDGSTLKQAEMSQTLINWTFDVHAKDVKLRFDLGDGSGRRISDVITQRDKKFTLPTHSYTNEGYTFVGYTVLRVGDMTVFGDGAWQKEADLKAAGGEKKIYKAGDTHTFNESWTRGYTGTSDYLFTGVWKPAEYEIRFDANGGTGAPDKLTKIHAKTVELPVAEPKRTGWVFQGWAESANAAQAVYQPGDDYTANKSVILYAVWTRDVEKAWFADNHADRFWKLENGKTEEMAAGAVSDLRHVIVTFQLSDKIRQRYSNLSQWATNHPMTITAHALPVSVLDQTLDFYAAPGQYDLVISDREGYVAKHTQKIRVSGDTKLTVELYELVLDFNGGSISLGNTRMNSVRSDFIYENYDSFVCAFGQLPEREGYTLIGWDEDPKAQEPEYPVNFYEHLFFRKDLKLYAIWEKTPETYTVNYDANGGTDAPEAQTKKEGESLILSSAVPVREGYDFLGWAKTANAAAAEYRAGGDYTRDESVTLYAVWQKQGFYLVDNNEGTCWILEDGKGAPTDMVDTSVLNHVTMTLKPSEQIWDEGRLQLDTWVCATAGAEVAGGTIHMDFKDLKMDFYISDGALDFRFSTLGRYTYTFTEDTDMVLNICELFLDFNGGQWADGTNQDGMLVYVIADQTRHFTTARQPVREGYTHLGWSRNPDAKVAEFAPNFSGLFLTDTVLYAVWQDDTAPQETYTVRYHAAGGDGEPASQTKIAGEPLRLSETVPTKEGYTFRGWAESVDAVVEDYPAGGLYTKDADVLLFAVWDEIGVFIIDNNADPKLYWEVTEDGFYGLYSYPEEKLEHVTLTLNPSESIRTRYPNMEDWPIVQQRGFITLDEVWMTLEDLRLDFHTNRGTHQVFLPMIAHQKEIDVRGDENIVWDICELVRDYNGGWAYEGDYQHQAEEHISYFAAGHDQTSSFAHTMKRDGYVFLGWSEDPNAEQARYAVGEEIPLAAFDGDTTLYAVWQKDERKFTVTYDANGGTGAPQAQTKYPGEPLTLDDTVPVREGYRFQGWSADPNATESELGDIYEADADITLYAIWRYGYTVSYFPNGGTGAPKDQLKVPGEPLTLSSQVPHIAGYNFQGWSDKPDAVEAQYQPGDLYMLDADVVLYAVWLNDTGVNGYTISFICYEASYIPWALTKTEGNDLIFPDDIPVREGHTFLGWDVEPAATRVVYRPGDAYTQDADITLYAVWQENTETAEVTEVSETGDTGSSSQTPVVPEFTLPPLEALPLPDLEELFLIP